MHFKALVGVLLVPTILLLVPWVAMQFRAGMAWSLFDFALIWVLMVGAGLTYKLTTRQAGNLTYRAAAGLASATAFFLVLVNLAVGVIGSEDNPANLLYGGVLAVALLGALIARFQATGMARALAATAITQLLVPVIALVTWRPEMSLGVVKVFVFNGVFALLFAVSAWLFGRAATPRAETVEQTATA